ncbi:MAG: PAS domain S-box protein, partial [Gallionella sp.]
NEITLGKEFSEKRTAHFLHELQVQRTELEMQNRELREAQQTLEETRDRYATLYDFAPVGYLTMDETGRVLEINLTGAAMLGLERANIVGKPFSIRFAIGDIPAFFHHLRQVFLSPGNIVTELRIMNRDGGMSYIRLESAAVLNKTRACHTVMTNITEQKRTALALQQARTEQEALLSAIPAIVCYKDLNLRYVTVSQMFADFLGRPVADVVGKTDFELFPHDLAEDLRRINREVLESGEIRTGMENRFTDAGGNKVYLSTVLAPFYNPEGKAVGLLGVGIDVSRLKKAASLNQELMLQNRTLMHNLYGIQEGERRHLARELHDEVGQWLTAIHAEAQAIGSMLGGKEHEIAASVRAINDSASEMHNVIHNMLRKLRPALLDELGLADSLRELVNQWQLHHHGIACDLVLEGDIDDFGENTNITAYRIIQEALSNIAKYAQADRISVRVRREPGETPGLDALLLCVEDNGKGFDPDQPSKGFGLLGMRERAIAAGGEFSLCNTPGTGVCIDVRLPLNYQIERRKK